MPTDAVRPPAAVLAALTLAALSAPLAAQDGRFTAPGPVADHPHAGATRSAGGRLAQAWEAALFPPGRVVLTSDDCPRAGARHEIVEGEEGRRPHARVVVCAGLVDTVRADLEATDASPAVRDSVVEAVLLFTFAHETAHAFAGLPAPGPADGSEEAADRFTALSLVSVPRLAHWAALYWAREPARLPDPPRGFVEALPDGRPSYAREHGLDAVRMADLLCLVYGERPDRRPWMVDASLVATGSAGRCPGAYRDAWERWGAIVDGRIDLPASGPAAREPGRTPGLAGLDPGGRGRARRRGGTPGDTVEEPAPWGEAEGLWSPYRARVGDVVAPLLADILRARRDLPGRAVVTYEPSPGTLDVEIYADERTPEAARRVVEDYRDYVMEAFRPYLKRRFGPELRARDLRILYYDATGDDPRAVIAFVRGDWARP